MFRGLTPPVPMQKDMVRSASDVLKNVDTGKELLVDARPPGRFQGTAPEPRPGIPSGHVPGAVNLPFPTVLEPEGRCGPFIYTFAIPGLCTLLSAAPLTYHL